MRTRNPLQPFTIYGIFCLILLGACSPANCTFDEFGNAQDEFEYRRLAPDKATLSVRFADRRVRIAPLVLAIPEDVSVEWNLLSGAGQRGSELIRFGREEALEIQDWIEPSRHWLSDIPLLAVNFKGVERASITRAGESSPVPVNIRQATFELVFSQALQSVPPSKGPNSVEPAKDGMRWIARILAVNPEDIDAVRGLPTTDTAEEHGSFSPISLGIHSDGVRTQSLRISTVGSGVVRITGRMARDAGLDTNARSLANLTLFHKGAPYPMATTFQDEGNWGDDDFIWFYHTPVESVQTNTNVYFLGWGDEPGLRIAEEDEEGNALKSGTCRNWDYSVIQLERDNAKLREPEGGFGNVDLFWEMLQETGDSALMDFDLPGLCGKDETENETDRCSDCPDRVPVRIRTLAPRGLDATATVSLGVNGWNSESLLLSATESLLKTTVPLEVLRKKSNRIKVVYSTQAAKGSPKFTYLDWVRLWWPTENSLKDPVLVNPRFPSNEASISLNPSCIRRIPPDVEGDWRLVVDRGSGQMTCRKLAVNEEDGTIETLSAESREAWCLFDLNRATPPEKIEWVTEEILHDTGRQADLLVVTDERFLPVLKEHLSWRENKEGWTYRLATTHQVYDEFSYGIKDLRAIRAYCDYAFRYYPEPRPQYVWLVGESRWDPRNLTQSPGEDMVPTPPTHPDPSIGSSDQEYVQVIGEDPLPDLFVSRVSVSTPEELGDYLHKVVTTEENRSLGWWRARSLMLTDESFDVASEKNLSRGLINHLLPTFIRMEDYPLDTIRNFEAIGRKGKEGRGIRQDVVEEWSQGAALVEYFGHGGITVWSKRALFKGLDRPDSDVYRLQNQGRYPLVLIRSCLSGAVNWPMFPGRVSVAEALVKAPSAGAVAALGASGTEFRQELELFARHIHGAIWNHRMERLSTIRAYAYSRFILRLPDQMDVADQFMLQGDPLLNLVFPQEAQIRTATWEASSATPVLRVEWSKDLTGYTGQLRVHQYGRILFESDSFRESEAAFGRWQIPLPTAALPNLTVALYFWDEAGGRDAFGGCSLPSFDWQAVKLSQPGALSAQPTSSDGERDSKPGDLKLSELAVDPKDPVDGETVFLTHTVTNTGNEPTRIENIRCSVQLEGGATRFLPRVGTDFAAFPFTLFPGQEQAHTWSYEAANPRDHVPVRFFVKTARHEVIQDASFSVGAAPEIDVLSIESAIPERSFPLEGPLELLVRYRNLGDIPTDPLVLVGRDIHSQKSFRTPLPVLEAGKIGETTLSFDTSQSNLSIDLTMKLPEKAITSRVKWKPQRFDIDFTREWDLREAMTDGRTWECVLEAREDLAPLHARYLESAERGFRYVGEAAPRRLGAGELHILNTSHVLAATEAVLGALQSMKGWWISPFSLQAHPDWKGTPLPIRVPWENLPALVGISPTYAKNDQYLGYRMPAFRMENGSETFNAHPNNTDFSGILTPKVVEISSPGSDWTLSKIQGAWTGFTGVYLVPLPEVRTPILVLPEEGDWRTALETEWIEKPPDRFSVETRTRKGDSDWSKWRHTKTEDLVRGDRIQMRCWFDPTTREEDLVIRSVTLRVKRNQE